MTMANLYLNKDDQAFLTKQLTFVEEILIDDQADDKTVDRYADIEHCRKLKRRIQQLGN